MISQQPEIVKALQHGVGLTEVRIRAVLRANAMLFLIFTVHRDLSVINTM